MNPVRVQIEDLKFVFGSGKKQDFGAFDWTYQNRSVRFFNCNQILRMAWLRRISSSPFASVVSSSMCLSATAFCVAKSVSTPLPSLKGELAEVVGELELAIGPAGSASPGIGADELGVGAEGKSLVREAAS